ncbi:hypothetical protein QMG83_08945 [Salinibacterium sp. G-O1]|uniref:hypothetical protein n=1 Tax=Salinibacterium sp. G-O1 TaxID=3046208 RepID=UPI0024BA73B6|nr:hypothetical protein [Salinibacterium sp. G-O1]MDJ0335348.1 hypothetical protein [Salinibacterium sp. G-O1]
MARPKVLASEMVTLKTRVAQTDDAALNSLAQATGEAKASHIRRALSQYVAAFALADHTTTSIVTHPTQKETTR